MTVNEIEAYLNTKNEILDSNVYEYIEKYRLQAIQNNNEDSANYLWCLRQIYNIQKYFLSVYANIKIGKYENAWNQLERTDIELSFLESNFDKEYSLFNDIYHLSFIKKMIKEYEKLFPYQYFMSREGIIKSEECSICGKKVNIRNRCPHKLGKLYLGEMCSYKVTDYQLLSMAIVKDPFDKYTVIHPEGLEYNYKMLEILISNLSSPYEKWYIDETQVVKPEYQNIGRNTLCPCGSLKKFKKCCINTDNIYSQHYRINFLSKPRNSFNENNISFVGTWA